jgi:tyrosinase
METLSFEDLSRRVFIKGLGFVSVGLILGTLGGCEQIVEEIKNRPTRRRLRTGSPEVDADIATYKSAVELMQGLSPSDPRNWASIAGIHGTVAGGFLYCQHGTVHFFDWHRAFLFFFEKICQKLTGNANFGLPYWNWNQNPDIHPAFLDSTSALYLPRANTTMAGSWSVSAAALDPIFADTNFYTFSSQLEVTPHNTVHSTIGDTMGTGGSALDPLFWVHHGMVDYSWAKWNIELGNNTTNDPSWANTVDSHFVDADKNPATEVAAVTTLMPLLSYQYESSAIGSSPALPEARTRADFQILERRIREGANVTFDIRQRYRVAERATISIAAPFSTETKLTAGDLSRIIDSDAVTERVFASVDFVALPPTSDFAVRVFVNLPGANRNTPNDEPHLAGSFAFFGTTQPGATPSAAGGHHHQPKFLVNLTNTLQRLKKNHELRDGSPITLQLVPTPFAEKFERDDTQLMLQDIDIIITPVIINPLR